MEPVSTIEGGVTFVDQDDVDTDQIIPARYMKRVERTGFGEFLFHEWRANGYDLPPTRSSSPGRTSARAPAASTRPGRWPTTASAR